MAEKPIYRLSRDEWDRDEEHRSACERSICDDVAHHYAKALDDGRVFVDGKRMTWT